MRMLSDLLGSVVQHEQRCAEPAASITVSMGTLCFLGTKLKQKGTSTLCYRSGKKHYATAAEGNIDLMRLQPTTSRVLACTCPT